MEIRRSKNALVVGSFTAISIAIFILAVFTLGGEKKTFTKKFVIKVVFTDINGLKEGNNVWFSGVKIGTVKKIDLKGKSDVEVTLSIDEKARAFISKDAMAKISSEGFLGNKLVAIYDGTSKGPPIENDHYLTVQRSEVNEDIMAILDSSGKNIRDITNSLKAISEKIESGQGTIGRLINDPSLASALQSTVNGFKATAYKSRTAMDNIEAFTARINAKGSSINKLLEDSVLYDSITNTIAGLKKLSDTANSFAHNINLFANNIRDASMALNDTMNAVGMVLNNKEVASDLQTTLNNIKSASRKLDEDLEALQHNFLFRAYFRKKQKDASKN